jgi:hypothetical protein
VAQEWTLRADWPEQRWWSDPQLVLTAFEKGMSYAVSVELRREAEGAPFFVTGVAVRRHKWADGWSGEPTHVSARDVQRLPLARIVRAALAAASTIERPTGQGIFAGQEAHSIVSYDYRDEKQRERFPPEEGDWGETARKILVPRGRPERGKSAAFYKEVADAHRQLSAATGRSPVKEIARRKRVSENTVHQWVHRARQLGFLEPSPRSRRRPDS